MVNLTGANDETDANDETGVAFTNDKCHSIPTDNILTSDSKPESLCQS